MSAADITVSIALSPFGLAYLASFAGGPVVFGGSVSSIGLPASPQQPFGGVETSIPATPPGSDPLIPMLLIETAAAPEPSATILGALGLLGLRLYRRRRL